MSFQRLYEDKVSEDKLYDIVSEMQDYNEAIRENNTYPYHYFLSPLRHNLFNWYPFKKDGNLLEIGAGYGQLTSLFTRKLDHVVAVEDSQSKCEIISKRAEEATVLVSDFNDLKVDEKFDYIVLCNAFEYAKSFVDSENPYVDYLNYLKGFLKDDGVILIALSNRLGLKYFAGFKEEHTDQLFSGINEYSNVDYVQTFTKTELSNIINDAGFSNYKFFYPYPNHEIPETVNTDKLINEIPFTGVWRYFDDRISTFDEVKLNLTLSKDNLLQYFANSFLVEIRASDRNYPSDNIDFVKIGADREEKHNVYTIIWSDGKVSKTPVTEKANEHIKRMYERSKYDIGKIKCLDAELRGNSLYYDFLNQKSCEYILLDIIAENDKDKFFEFIEDIHDALFYNSFESDEYATEEFLKVFSVKSDIKFHCHEKSYIDTILGNMFIVDGEFTVIDYEWILDFPVPLEYLFFRVFNYHFFSNELIREFTNFEEIFDHFNMDIEYLSLFKEWECSFLRHIISRPIRTFSQILPFEDIYKTKQLQKDNNLMRKELKNKNKLIEKKNKELKKKDNEIKSLLNSKSWKITKPMRKLKSVLKK